MFNIKRLKHFEKGKFIPSHDQKSFVVNKISRAIL